MNRLEELFFSQGYDKIPSNLPEFIFYCRREAQGINVLYVIDYRQNLYISADQYDHIKKKIIDFFQARGERGVHVMALVLCADTEKARQLCEKDSFCWIIDTQAYRLMIHETKASDFYGWKNLLEEYLFELEKEGGETQIFDETVPKKTIDLRELSWTNIVLVSVNVIVFLICTFTGNMLYNKGALSVMELGRGGQIYRLFTSMFLHWNVEHLFSNMIVLYYVGALVERELGPLPYTVLYLLSGLAGNIFSIGYELLSGIYGSSAGASGAIFGVEGALLFLVMIRREKLGTMPVGRVAFAVAFSLYCGFTSAGVDNAAHVGGVLMGFITAAVIAVCKRMKILSDYR
ncbi:MAG: rhomboid family intramembrane serine protease [Lachnospiraceae bacterium]|nr:rhomboid family intramembrane serine protease [Lachnospiraceae bacterium]